MSENITRVLQLMQSLDRRLENFKKLGRAKLTAAKVRSRISSLRELWLQVQDGHMAILEATTPAAMQNLDYFKEERYDNAEETYQATLDYMSEVLEELEPPASPSNVSLPNIANRSTNNANALTKLPSIRLPNFSGTLSEWEPFRDKFTTLIIRNPDLTDFSRMHFLISCLTERALDCVRHLADQAEQFDVAWTALTTRYDNKDRLLQKHLSTLLNLPVVSRESATEIQALSDRVSSTVASLNHLNRTAADLWNDMLIHLVAQRLDPITRQAWKLKTTEFADPPAFTVLAQFLADRSRSLEEPPSSANSRAVGKTARLSNVNVATATASHTPQCPVCKARHYFSACPNFVKGTPSYRRELVRKHGRCFNCLSHNHSVKACKSKYTCRMCHQPHHTMLHASSPTDAPSAETSAPRSTHHEERPEVQALFAARQSENHRQILLATALISISGPDGRVIQARALLDQGSEMSFITENLAQVLRVKRLRLPITVTAVGCVHAGTFNHAAVIAISPRDSRSPSLRTTALILPSLTSYAPKRVRRVASWSHLAGISWADPDPASSTPISLLLGADLYGDIVLDGIRKGPAGSPIAQQSIFGWIISGPLDGSERHSRVLDDRSINTLAPRPVSSFHCLGPSLENEIKRFWEIEEPPAQSIPTPAESQCETHFVKTHSRSASGRYIVRLPFRRDSPIELGESRSRAKSQLNSLMSRLQSRPDHLAKYQEFLSEYESLGHLKETQTPESTALTCVYLPHHPVFRDSSSTTQLRVVFNASSPTSNGASLNDNLLAGPKLQTFLPAVILKWRKYRFVCAADIAKMYRQIRVDDRDINFQRILWKPSARAPISEYQLLTVTYGMSCAPFLALRVLKQLVIDEGFDYPLAAPILTTNIYVDDVLFGHNELSTLREMRDQLRGLLGRGGFELRKWASNSSALLSDIDESDHGIACSRLLSDSDTVNILGIEWSPGQDLFRVQISLSSSVPRSKRSILSAIARLYDPLGWVTPVIISAKIIMQHIWQLGIEWDELIPDSLFVRWRRLYESLSRLQEVQIPRWVGFGNHVRAELHGFADASNVAYAAVIYVRILNADERATVTLLIGKSKVAPLKLVSVPRLELLGAALLARLVEFIRDVLAMNTQCYCWTDSTVVLAWLRHHPSRWHTFVANRVADIQRRLPDAQWRHVPTEDNPADCASRGLVGNELLSHPLWWCGPSWLKGSTSEWPHHRDPGSESTSLETRNVVAHVSQSQPSWDLETKFSSWPRLVRVTAYVMRFASLCRRLPSADPPSEARGGALSVNECRDARQFWLRRIQADVFPTEVRLLANARSLPATNSILSLNPFLDDSGLLRVGGRLSQVRNSFADHHPILLAKHPLVTLIVEQAHSRSLHAGLQLTLCTLRRDVWIIRARGIVRAVIHRCIRCTRERAAVPTQLMGDLPASRVNAPSRCFLHCGLDYAGPIVIRASAGRGITSRKAYIALFVCLASRAIHIELVADYSTPAFLNAYSRFCARRGLPQSLYSDNGTTFVGANRELASAYRRALRDPDFQNRTLEDKVTWHFIPPAAPHFGGIWEAGVRSVKHHLRRVLGDRALTFEELSTLLCRIEAVLNSRPIAPLNDTLDDYESLTPGHLLIGSALTASPEPSLLDLKETRLSRWQLLRHKTERFWRLWQNDYINTLQQRSKWRQAQPAIREGQLVLLREHNLPPCKWPLGRVTQCHPGLDGFVRVVTVKTAKSEFKRAIGKLCALPVDCDATPVKPPFSPDDTSVGNRPGQLSSP